LEADVVWYPEATHVVGFVHETASKPPCCDPRLGLGVTDHVPLAKVRINGRSEEASPVSVFPTATQVVGVAQDTP
jgi:hypothetical protein